MFDAGDVIVISSLLLTDPSVRAVSLSFLQVTVARLYGEHVPTEGFAKHRDEQPAAPEAPRGRSQTEQQGSLVSTGSEAIAEIADEDYTLPAGDFLWVACKTVSLSYDILPDQLAKVLHEVVILQVSTFALPCDLHHGIVLCLHETCCMPVSPTWDMELT